jgi:hypothetical protein
VILNDFPSAQRVAVSHRTYDRWRAEGGGLVIDLADGVAAGGVSEMIVWR